MPAEIWYVAPLPVGWPACVSLRDNVCMQVWSAAEEYHAEYAAKEAMIAMLTAEVESARLHMQAKIDKLRSDMEVGGRFTWGMCLTDSAGSSVAC